MNQETQIMRDVFEEEEKIPFWVIVVGMLAVSLAMFGDWEKP